MSSGIIRMTAVRRVLLPALLILISPPITLLLWYTHVVLGGSFSALIHEFENTGIIRTIAHVWGPVAFGSRTAWTMIAIYTAVELALMRLLPGRTIHGAITPGGNTPVYKVNGLAAFAVTMLLYIGGSFGLGLFPATIIYDHFGELVGALILSSILFCLLLYVKGRVKPSTSDTVF